MSKFFVGGTNLLKGRGLVKLSEPGGLKISSFLRRKKGGASIKTTVKTGEKTEKYKDFISDRSETAQSNLNEEKITNVGIKISVYAALPENDRIPKLIENSIKAGAESVSFFKSRTSSTEEKDEKSVLVWKNLAEEALSAAGREEKTEAYFFEEYEAMLYAAMRSDAALLLYEKEDEERLTVAEAAPKLRGLKSVSIVSGSEKGISKKQMQLAKKLGFTLISLGPDIIRCEDAPCRAITLLESELLKNVLQRDGE